MEAPQIIEPGNESPKVFAEAPEYVWKPQLKKPQLMKPALKTVPMLDGLPTKETPPPEILGAVAHQHSPDGLGFISDYAEYVDVLEAPRMLHEMVAIQVVASVLNRNGVVIPHGALDYSLDLWMVLLSGSGHGRSTVVNIVRDLLKAAKMPDLVRDSDWGSEPALYQDLAEHSDGLFIWGELSEKLQKLKTANFASAKQWITDRYDNFQLPEAKQYRKTGKDGDTPPIEFTTAPRINILATSSEDWFFRNLGTTDSAGGFIPRWVLVRSEGHGRSVPTPLPLDQAKKKPLLECLRQIRTLKGPADISEILPLYEEWYEPAKQRFLAQPNPDLAGAYFNRHRQHILKLAVIYEAATSHTLRVSKLSWLKAQEMAGNLEKTIFSMLTTGMNALGFDLQKMEERIRRAGSHGISKSELTRAFQAEPAMERERRVKTLIDAGRVFSRDKSTAGRPATFYIHHDYRDPAALGEAT